MWPIAFWLLMLWGFLSFGTYIILHLVTAVFYKTQNLKKRYNATWAMVTGASSGIGKSLAFKLAKQGLNVVLVALQDDLLDQTFAEIVKAFPACQFRKVGANLGKPGYLKDIAAATEDIDVQIFFCNAGYMVTGFFYTRDLETHLANLECNAVSAVQITHHFCSKLVAKKLRGCFVYTSSAAAAIASPVTALYAASKAFISSFGASLAPEVNHLGIDVLVFHPSPVASRFYDKSHKLGILEFFRSMAVHPDMLPDTIFASIGRTVWRDIGPTAICFRLLMKVIDYNALATLTAFTSHTMADFKRHILETTKTK